MKYFFSIFTFITIRNTRGVTKVGIRSCLKGVWPVLFTVFRKQLVPTRSNEISSTSDMANVKHDTQFLFLIQQKCEAARLQTKKRLKLNLQPRYNRQFKRRSGRARAQAQISRDKSRGRA